MYGAHYQDGAASMISLKSRLPSLAARLNMSPAALYERQRALVRAELLKVRPGRGPGSGVPLTAASLATLLISVVATTSLSEVEAQTKFIGTQEHRRNLPTYGQKDIWRCIGCDLERRGYVWVSTITVERKGQAAQAMMVYRSEFR